VVTGNPLVRRIGLMKQIPWWLLEQKKSLCQCGVSLQHVFFFCCCKISNFNDFFWQQPWQVVHGIDSCTTRDVSELLYFYYMAYPDCLRYFSCPWQNQDSNMSNVNLSCATLLLEKPNLLLSFNVVAHGVLGEP
jgi:hypothetical protein